jgi:fermentation-respiration switch protein FrsA (DUF1100 family)
VKDVPDQLTTLMPGGDGHDRRSTLERRTGAHPVAARIVLTAVALLFGGCRAASGEAIDTVVIRGHSQTLHLYGVRGHDPVIVSSGDGGWLHLGPYVAEFLAGQGFFVVGFDTKAYLESFTTRTSVLSREDEPADYQVLADYAARGSGKKAILIGVSEGAGLSVLAATDPTAKRSLAGVIALGLPDLNELGWRWKDSVIYLTHGSPNEPAFKVTTVIDRVAPLPLAAIQSTHDEFVALADVRRTLDRARLPKRLWIVDASNHRFSGNLEDFDRCLLQAMRWIAANGPH